MELIAGTVVKILTPRDDDGVAFIDTQEWTGKIGIIVETAPMDSPNFTVRIGRSEVYLPADRVCIVQRGLLQ